MKISPSGGEADPVVEPSTAPTPRLDPHTMPAALLELGLDGVIRAAAGSLLTVTPRQLIGRSLWDLVEDEQAVARIQRGLAGEPVTGVARWGGRLWQSNYSPIFDDGVLTGVAAGFVDITDHLEAHGVATAPNPLFESVLLAVAEAVVVIGTDGTVTWANPHCTPLFGQELRPGMSLDLLVDAPIAQHLLERRAARPAEQTDRYELPIRSADGTDRWVLVSASTVRGEDGQPLGSVAVMTDITGAKAEQRRLEVVALTDSLTGVANRVALSDRLRHALQRRDAGVVGILFCDVDGLKRVNDELGHAAGDALLLAVARRAGAVLRPEDTLSRYGGDEFVVLCEGLDEPGEVLRLAERIADAVAVPLEIFGRQLVPTVSIGVATAPPEDTPAALLACADKAAYDAKRAGRGQVRLAQR